MAKSDKKTKARAGDASATPSIKQLPLPPFSDLSDFYKENPSVQESFEKWHRKKQEASIQKQEEAEDSDDESSDSDRWALSLPNSALPGRCR